MGVPALSGASPPGAVLIGREQLDDGMAGEKAHYSGPLHVVMFGPNGVGKGMRVLVPNLLTITGKSIVVVDPKGQLAAMTAKYRHQAGNDVKIVDPFGEVQRLVENDPQDRYAYLREHNLHKSVGFNPLSALNPHGETFFDDAAVLSEALIKVSSQDPHWSESAQGLVTGLIMWERMMAGKRGADLVNVRQMLTQADDTDPDGRPIAGLIVTASEMVEQAQKTGHYGYAVADLAARFASSESSDEMNSIRSTADTQTRWLLSRPMRADLLKNGIDFRTLKTGERPTTVYVVLPAGYLETHSIWLRLIVSEALRANLTMGGRGLMLIMDEFAALGHLSIVQKLFGVVRDYRIQMMPIFQDLPQLKTLYAERWETLLGMAGVVQSFRTGDLTTAKWISERSGQMQVDVESVTESESHDGFRLNRSHSTSIAPQPRPTIYPHDMFGLADGYTVTYWSGERRPLKVYVPHVRQVPSLYDRALPNPYYNGP